MTTIVSAFVSNINTRQDMNLHKYYEYGKLLLKSTTPKIIFLDEPMLDLIKDDYDNSNTLLIKINKEDNYLYEYRDLLSNFKLNTYNAKKDTMDYILTMCHKTEWMKTAIGLNNFNTKNFIWIDFGIKYIFNCSDEEFTEKINNIHNKSYSNIRVGKIWNLNISYSINIYKDIAWYFAGGVFGGNKDKMLIFSEKMKNKCIDIIFKENTLMWEVNIWYLLYLENKEIFDTYYCNHDNTLLENY
jgi:hypothetical protein